MIPFRFLTVSLVIAASTGCATGGQQTIQPFAAAQKSALSIDDQRAAFAVAVSPARQTLQFAGTIGLVAGSSISAVADDHYRQRIKAAFGDYDPGALFRERLENRLAEQFGAKLTNVEPLAPPTGNQTQREAVRNRLDAFAESGVDMLLDTNISYGVFGPSANIVARIDAKLIALPSRKELWEGSVYAFSDPFLAGDSFRNPINRVRPRLQGLGADDDALARWTTENGDPLRKAYEECVNGAVSALVDTLGLAQEAEGEYRLGVLALIDEDFEQATQRFLKALELDPAHAPAQTALSLAIAEGDRLQDALGMAEQVVQTHPDYGPAWYNLAYWYVEDVQNATAARPYYERAKALGMPPIKVLETE